MLQVQNHFWTGRNSTSENVSGWLLQRIQENMLTFFWFHVRDFLKPHLPSLAVTWFMGLSLALPVKRNTSMMSGPSMREIPFLVNILFLFNAFELLDEWLFRDKPVSKMSKRLIYAIANILTWCNVTFFDL